MKPDQQARICFLLTFFGLCFIGPLEAAEYPSYEINASVDVNSKTMAVQQKTTFVNRSRSDVNEILFHVYANREYSIREQKFMMRFAGYFKTDFFPEGFQAPRIHLKSVRLDGRELPYTIEGQDKTLLSVKPDRTLKPGETVPLDFDYQFDFPHAYGRLGWHDRIFRASRWYPILAVQTDVGWDRAPFYPFHRPFFSEAARYHVKLTVPSEYVVIHSGDLAFEHEEGGATTLEIETPQPVREFTFAMSPDYRKKTGEFEGIKINSYYLPGDELHGEMALHDAEDLMKFYTKWFGPYPYSTFSIAPVHLGYGGEQMSNMVFIDTRAYRLPRFLDRYFDFLISHETGHQWIYNLVGLNEYSQMWLEEGVNSYFNLLYLEDKYGKDAEVIDFPSWMEDWTWMLPKLTFRNTRVFRYKMLARTAIDRPVVGDLSSFQEPGSIFSITYGKGSRIVEMLHSLLGDEVFHKVFKQIFHEYRFRNLSLDEFIALCEKESGRQLDWFFTPWLKESKLFDYAVKGVKGGEIMIENRGGFSMPVDVAVKYKDGSTERLTLDPDRPVKKLQARAPGIKSVQVDPDVRWLDIDRTNNTWPRKVEYKLVPLYFGIYDMPLFMDEDAYNVIAGPEINNGIGLKAALHKPYDYTFYTGADYELGEDLFHSRTGFQLNNVFHSQTAAGFEISSTDDLDGGDEDLTSGKIYLRKELWPAQYGLTDINDHITLYLLRNKNLNDATDLSRETVQNTDYSRRNESIVGLNFHLNRSGPYPDPREGYQLNTLFESAGHFFNATQYFERASVDTSFYQPVTPASNLAFRFKYGWGQPDDKELFYLGGIDGLRGYERKEVRGANALLGSVEYRFPLLPRFHLEGPDHLFSLEKISGVVFADAGQSWFSGFEGGDFKKNAGAGLRFHVNIGSFLEKVVVRLDAAKAINDSSRDTQVWLGVNHAF